MAKKPYIAIFIIILFFCLLKSGWAADDNIIRAGNETIVGRSKDYEPASKYPSTLIFTLDEATFKAEDVDKISKLCKSVDRVQSFTFSKVNCAIALSIERRSGDSVESVAGKIKSMLREKLGIMVIETRIIN